MEWFYVVCALCVGVLIGNLQGDQATLRDCATKGVAVLAGGGSVSCAPIKTT